MFPIDVARMVRASAAYPSAPTFFGAGAYQSGIGSLSVPWPAGHQADDVGILLVHSNNQTISTPGTTNLIASGPGTGSAGGAGGTRRGLFWIRATSGAQANITVADSGNVTGAQLFVFRGCRKAGNPYEAHQGGLIGSTTAISMLATTYLTGINRGILGLLSHSRDLTGTANVSGWANTATTGMTEIGDASTASSNGGGLAAAYGVSNGQTTSERTTATLAAAASQEYSTLVLVPDGIPSGGFVPAAENASVTDNGTAEAVYTITAPGPVVWNWTSNTPTGLIASVATGGTASSITFELVQGTSDRSCLVQVTSGNYTWNIDMFQTGSGGGGVTTVGVGVGVAVTIP